MPHDGVGLARLEFIINSHIGIHPLALVDYDKLKVKLEDEEEMEEVAHKHGMTRQEASEKLRKTLETIDERTLGYENKEQFFIDKLAQGIATIASAFYPNPVVTRLSDFKTNEYFNLVGGWLYEPKESNPMIGYRGCSRYYHPLFQPAFRLECKAFRVARDYMGLTNIKIMFPFCRTIEEAEKTIGIMDEEGLKRGKNGLELYCMAEVPSNIILADQFAKYFDGFSIGSNDLTQLTLGIDRDSELLIHLFNEDNDAVTRAVADLIKTAHKHKTKVGICGQWPSDSEFGRRFLVENGIDSMSLNPDTVVQAYLDVADVEKKLKQKRAKKRKARR
jgi:pyruvate,water dikinase